MAIERRFAVLAVSLALASGTVLAHGDSHQATGGATRAKVEQKPFGIAGDPAAVTRTIEIDMTDRMKFEPAGIAVKQGETVRFVLRNRGATMHEMVIGTTAELKAHAALMRKFPDMEHDEPYMAHVAPGTSGEIVWRFNRAGTFQFACLVPGHFEAGMVGRVVVR